MPERIRISPIFKSLLRGLGILQSLAIFPPGKRRSFKV